MERGQLERAGLRYEEEKEKYNQQAGSRERLGDILRRRADNLEREAKQLYELSKSVDLLPEALEMQLYPFVMGYINLMDRQLNRI